MNQENNKREATTFDAQAVNSATGAFFKRWWKLLTVVFVVAAIISAVAAMFIKPLYLSTGVMMPTNSNRLTKAIMDYHYSMDFMDYGAEYDCEHAVQILTSKQMEMAVCDHFNLMEHYAIKPTSKYPKNDLSKRYKRYVTIKRTDYLGVQVSVLDQDPQMAADMAKRIVANMSSFRVSAGFCSPSPFGCRRLRILLSTLACFPVSCRTPTASCITIRASTTVTAKSGEFHPPMRPAPVARLQTTEEWLLGIPPSPKKRFQTSFLLMIRLMTALMRTEPNQLRNAISNSLL